MATLLTKYIATMTEMREPHKLLDRSEWQPVAALKNYALVGYIVPAESMTGDTGGSQVTDGALHASLTRRAAKIRPVLDYLKGK